ncbi:TAD2-tRNA-specific adenosine deaminase 2 [Fusarium albosuccineum]|uniref:TAD2-tRNA-specific adenosine deaminase 2 n=1 Tax=Fusarium albosuccineum TaxID=1237068 RepID=A0A8H4LMJ9_9HYPO|nr:TAD2-tRNA-specific adenosine deaminase 2 [Fusarium albosuccineum]
MGMLKSLGLSPVKKAGAKAFRRLFGRTTAAENESDSATGTSENGKNNSAQKNPSNERIHSNRNDQQQTSHDDLASSSPSTDPADKRHNSTTENDHHPSSNPTATESLSTTEDMASPRKQQINPRQGLNKENQPPSAAALSESLARLSLDKDNATATLAPKPVVPATPIFTDPVVLAERAKHMQFIEEALDMARLALRTNETPVGCVLVHDGKVIARGMNATNVTRNGTRHAEFMALGALLSYPPADGPRTTTLRPQVEKPTTAAASDASSVESGPSPHEGNEDGSKGHLYPYGQKCHPDARVDRSIVRESILYVTVEPCVMCASLLRQLGVKKVYFGAVNDKFGGTGGVFSIHANSLPVSADGQTASAHPTPKPAQLPDGSGTLGVSYPPGGGDGGNIEHGYEIEGGWGRDEAVALLRRFYVQENGRAPVPRKKEGRAARLAAMMEKDGEEALTPDAATPVPDGVEPAELPTSTAALKEGLTTSQDDGTETPLADRTEA